MPIDFFVWTDQPADADSILFIAGATDYKDAVSIEIFFFFFTIFILIRSTWPMPIIV